MPRISDLSALVPSTQGKIEVEAMEEGHEDEVVAQLVAAATLAVFRRRVTLDDPQSIVAPSTSRSSCTWGTISPRRPTWPSWPTCPSWSRHPQAGRARGGRGRSPALMASALEFLLEGLHLTKRLNKDASGARALYRGRK